MFQVLFWEISMSFYTPGNPWDSCPYDPHFTDEEIEAQGS